MNKPKIIPRKKYILVKGDPEESRISKSGIVKPGNVEQEKKSVGEVLGVGNQVSDIKVGDKVVYGTYAGDPVKSGDEEFRLLHDDDVLAFIK